MCDYSCQHYCGGVLLPTERLRTRPPAECDHGWGWFLLPARALVTHSIDDSRRGAWRPALHAHVQWFRHRRAPHLNTASPASPLALRRHPCTSTPTASAAAMPRLSATQAEARENSLWASGTSFDRSVKALT